jgi:steroid delta-isomerase-like uncharacterized protein
VSRNADLVESTIKAFNDHDYEALGAAFTDEATWTDVPGGTTAEGRAEIVEYMAGWHAGFSNARVTEPEYIAANGTVAVRFVGRGTQSAEFGPGPFPNKGREFNLRGVQVYTIDESGLITHVDLYYDTMTMLTQLGHMS